jgi:CRISPR system Cascade subunit CasE
MYLTLLRLNLRARRVQRELANRYELHRSLMQALGAEKPPGERLLYRLEEGQVGMQVLVQTQTNPDWSFLQSSEFEGYLLSGMENPQVKTFDPVFVTGQRLIFRLQANPTRREPARKEKVDGKRRGLYDEAEQLAWLGRRAEMGGFGLCDVRMTNLGMITGLKKGKDQVHHLKLVGVQFDGVLEVADPEAFGERVKAGIGSGKGFGFGLLSVAKA